MILISHRGNTTRSIPERENDPKYIHEAIVNGFHVEVDVWFIDGKFKLGHDKPQYDFPHQLLEHQSNKLWIHCKNLDAIAQFNILDKDGIYINYFWHQEDDITLTSKGYIWAYPGKQPIENSIAVMPELNNDDLSKCIGICSDNIAKYKK
tara:strand:- start:202 stop:651 length:450 start_codon:yes stop_codon:yes gene_type:complete